MKNLALTILAAGSLLAAAGCDKSSSSPPRPNAPSQSSQTTPSRPGPPGGQSARPGELSPGGSEAVQSHPPRRLPDDAPRAAQGSPGAADNPSTQASVSAQTIFDAVDQDKNGVVDLDESSAIPGLNFGAADTDKDDSLSRQEFMTAMAGTRPPG